MKVKLQDIIAAIRSDHFRITDHADEEAAADEVTLDEILFSVEHGEIIEDYPTHRPYPSCLIFGRSQREEPLHSVWAYNEANGWAVLITAYRPDPDRWVDFRQRRPQA